ncbi:uncharacterized protein MELLADRAFT_114111 [Melampsora larici-populina 98AG31]|uniref:Secreted protein n=1 Tax=Melampsora larici-populina (strain 98AG31 / pathotype 3-4-7) TaxID=747676 RepID=F4SC76_MELLP|nr:uncharacterized protein MELLADRAFT_114111 [Melampsora larici-populina 98AG31]EGF97759.1 secreted protein [Melampsora larici-populina 98AG31]
MRLTAILSIILFGSTRHIWCGPYDDVDGYKAMILAYRDNRVLLSYPDNALPKNKGGNGKMLCFPRGKPKEMDEGDTRQTAQRELKEETGYELELDEFEYIMEVDDRTKLFVAKIPSNAKAVQGADTHNRNNVWVDPLEVAGCIKNRQDSMAAWHSECYRFQGVEDF